MESSAKSLTEPIGKSAKTETSMETTVSASDSCEGISEVFYITVS